MVRQSAHFALFLMTAASLGCGGNDERDRFKEGLVPVTGKVTLDGEPLAGVGILFAPTSSLNGNLAVGARASFGTLDAEGKYTLLSPPQGNGVLPEEFAGCLPGEYAVALMDRSGGAGRGGVVVESPAATESAVSTTPSRAIPPKFSNPKSSGMQATVGPEGGEFNFDLKSQ